MKKDNFSSLFESVGINPSILKDLALETGLMERQRSLSALDILFAFCTVSTQGEASYNSLAARIEAEDGVSVSKQSIWKKVSEPCKVFFEKVLEQVILEKMGRDGTMARIPKNQFKRILIQDSTIIKLPARLFEVFSGVSNGHTQVCNARIQGVYDLVSGKFVSFSIDPYSKNDLKAAPELHLQEGDLVLRDRGYLINDEFKRHINNLAHCIFRYKYGVALLNPQTGKPIDILRLLEKKLTLTWK